MLSSIKIDIGDLGRGQGLEPFIRIERRFSDDPRDKLIQALFEGFYGDERLEIMREFHEPYSPDTHGRFPVAATLRLCRPIETVVKCSAETGSDTTPSLHYAFERASKLPGDEHQIRMAFKDAVADSVADVMVGIGTNNSVRMPHYDVGYRIAERLIQKLFEGLAVVDPPVRDKLKEASKDGIIQQ
jgi:hypothetical protein